MKKFPFDAAKLRPPLESGRAMSFQEFSDAHVLDPDMEGGIPGEHHDN